MAKKSRVRDTSSDIAVVLKKLCSLRQTRGHGSRAKAVGYGVKPHKNHPTASYDIRVFRDEMVGRFANRPCPIHGDVHRSVRSHNMRMSYSSCAKKHDNAFLTLHYTRCLFAVTPRTKQSTVPRYPTQHRRETVNGVLSCQNLLL